MDNKPLNKHIRVVAKTLSQRNTLMNNNLKHKLNVTNSELPLMYCLPKIHKPGNSIINAQYKFLYNYTECSFLALRNTTFYFK